MKGAVSAVSVYSYSPDPWKKLGSISYKCYVVLIELTPSFCIAVLIQDPPPDHRSLRTLQVQLQLHWRVRTEEMPCVCSAEVLSKWQVDRRRRRTIWKWQLMVAQSVSRAGEGFAAITSQIL